MTRATAITLLALCFGATPPTRPAEITTISRILSSAVPRGAIPVNRHGWTTAKLKEIRDDVDRATVGKNLQVNVDFVVDEVHYFDNDKQPGPRKRATSCYVVWGRVDPFEGIPVRVVLFMKEPPEVRARIKITSPLVLALLERDDKYASGVYFLFTFDAMGERKTQQKTRRTNGTDAQTGRSHLPA